MAYDIYCLSIDRGGKPDIEGFRAYAAAALAAKSTRESIAEELGVYGRGDEQLDYLTEMFRSVFYLEWDKREVRDHDVWLLVGHADAEGFDTLSLLDEFVPQWAKAAGFDQ